MLDEVELPWGQLAIDTEMKHGQIRQLNVIHREALTEQFKANPPHAIELVTVLDQDGCAYRLARQSACILFK